MVSLGRLRAQIEKEVDEPVSVYTCTNTAAVDVHDAKVLVEVTDLETGMAEHHEVHFRGQDSDTTYAETRYFRFTDASIAHIDWMKIDPSIEGNGYGRLLRRVIVERLTDVDAVYSKIVNDRLISTAIDQGFKQIQDGDLKGWFVRE